jgi:transmembrane sensor
MDIGKAIKYLTGIISHKERNIFEKWLNEKVEHLIEFQQFSSEWKNAEESVKEFNPDANVALNKWRVNESYTSGYSQARKKVHRLKPRRIAIAAASVLVIASVLYIHFRIRNRDSDKAYVTYIASDSLRYFQLSDETKVWLNSGSQIELQENFGKFNRNVCLQGEAYFEVSKDASNPFTLTTMNTVTQVLGTKFNLNSTALCDKISLVEGKISFCQKDRPENAVLLTPGVSAIYNAKEYSIDTTHFHDQNFIAWKTGKLHFRNTPLPEVISDIADYYKLSIGEIPPVSDSYNLTSDFDNQPVSQVIAVLELTLNLDITMRNDTLNVKNQ